MISAVSQYFCVIWIIIPWGFWLGKELKFKYYMASLSALVFGIDGWFLLNLNKLLNVENPYQEPRKRIENSRWQYVECSWYNKENKWTCERITGSL